jgi:hypothetical protein
MPKFYLNIRLDENTVEAERDLEDLVIIKGKFKPLNLYMVETEIPVDIPGGVAEAYKNLLMQLIGKKHVRKVERSVELQVLSAIGYA